MEAIHRISATGLLRKYVEELIHLWCLSLHLKADKRVDSICIQLTPEPLDTDGFFLSELVRHLIKTKILSTHSIEKDGKIYNFEVKFEEPHKVLITYLKD